MGLTQTLLLFINPSPTSTHTVSPECPRSVTNRRPVWLFSFQCQSTPSTVTPLTVDLNECSTVPLDLFSLSRPTPDPVPKDSVSKRRLNPFQILVRPITSLLSYKGRLLSSSWFRTLDFGTTFPFILIVLGVWRIHFPFQFRSLTQWRCERKFPSIIL